MKKTKLLTAIVALLALGMTACGAKSNPSSGSSAGGKSTSSAPSHTHVWDNGVVTTNPTCDTEGVKTFTCTGEGTCPNNNTKTEPVEALGHQWGEGQDVNATGEAIAYKKFACGRTGCGAIKYEVSVKDGAEAAGIDTTDTGSTGRISSAPEGFIKLKASDSFEFSINSEVAGTGKLYLRVTMDNWNDSSNHNEQKNLFYGKENRSAVEKDTTNLKISINNTALTVTNKKSFEEMLPAIDNDQHPAAQSGWSAIGDILFGDDLVVNSGVNTIKYERVDSYNPAVSHLLFVFTPTQA